MRRLPLAIAALLTAAGAVTLACRDEADGLRWYRGNTHTHTLWSDGDAAPEVVADWYVENGYQFLVLSDHNLLSSGERWFPIEEGGRLTPAHVEALRLRFGEDAVELRDGADGRREMRLRTLDELRARFEQPGAFLLVQGEEITDGHDGRPVHVNGLNLLEAIEPRGGDSVAETVQRNFDAVREQSERLGRPMVAHLNHPNFGWGVSPEELADLRGEAFFEVHNGHPAVRNEGDDEHASTEQLWDRVLTRRLATTGLGPLWGLATDDAHHYHATGPELANVGRGWIVVRAAELTSDALMAALRDGEFYATNGVELRRVERGPDAYTVEIDADDGVTYRTVFVGTRVTDGDPGAPGEVLFETRANPARYEYAGDELYVRARVESSRPHPNPYRAGLLETAWTQPAQPGAR